jgi:hypothetical protein
VEAGARQNGNALTWRDGSNPSSALGVPGRREITVIIRHADGTEEHREGIPDTPEARRAVDRAAWHMLAQDDVRGIWVECEKEK